MLPEIKNDHGIMTLYVNGEPFFALSGEIHNSSASSLSYMQEKVWPALSGLHMNSVIVPVYWETMEPEEGQFDFTLPDVLIRQARQNDMHLIFLWFGLWKNSESMYVPAWIKRDSEKYYLVKKINGEAINTISPLCREAVEKDARAFSALMAHIRVVDSEESTVLFVQVENEIGLLGTARDFGTEAQKKFASPIPEEMSHLYGASGPWKNAFGENAEEYFMAFHFANAVEYIASAGKKEYPLPMYVNSWLKQYPWYPGSYPSGGPVPDVHRIWKTMAPDLFALAPDIYVPYAAGIMDEYGYEGNPLVIPEIRKDAVTASYCLYAFGAHNAICYAPFGIEDLILDPDEIEKPPLEVMAALNIDPSAMDITGSRGYLSETYSILEEIRPLYLKYRGTEHLKTFLKKSDTDYGAFLHFEKYDLQIAYQPKMPAGPLPSGMVFELSPDRFYLVGMMCTCSFSAKTDEKRKVGILRLEEGRNLEGRWQAGRILNGDERMSLKFRDHPTENMLELYLYS